MEGMIGDRKGEIGEGERKELVERSGMAEGEEGGRGEQSF